MWAMLSGCHGGRFPGVVPFIVKSGLLHGHPGVIVTHPNNKLASRCLLFQRRTRARQENRSDLSFTARIITKYSLKRSLSICGEKMSKSQAF